MKNFLIKLAISLWVIWWLTLVTSCVTSSPTTRYAREHRSKEFTDWKKVNKQLDKNEKAKPKEHARKNKY